MTRPLRLVKSDDPPVPTERRHRMPERLTPQQVVRLLKWGKRQGHTEEKIRYQTYRTRIWADTTGTKYIDWVKCIMGHLESGWAFEIKRGHDPFRDWAERHGYMGKRNQRQEREVRRTRITDEMIAEWEERIDGKV